MSKDRKPSDGATLTLDTLEELGVSSIFGYPGGAIMPIYDAIYDSPIKHYLSRHEQGSAFAAIGYAKSSHKVGVCMATSGPGGTNLLTALADALADSIPLVAITGQVSSRLLGSDGFQEVDMVGLSLACTKWCYQVTQLEEIPEVLNRAFFIAKSGRPGPVLIDIPKDIQLARLKKKKLGTIKSRKTVDCSLIDNDFKTAESLINSAQKPMLYIGGGVGMADAVDELNCLINQTQMPAVSTLKGLGSVNPAYKNNLGMLGMHGLKGANLAVQECDLLLVLGARFDDRVTGKLNEFAISAKVIHLDIDAAEIDKRRKADVSIIGNLKQTLPRLTKQLKHLSQTNKTWQDRCQELKNSERPTETSLIKGIQAPALLARLNQIKGNAIVTTDVGQHQMWAAQHLTFNQPSQFITSGTLGTMGFGLPAAIGAQICKPKKSVICVTGDGSFMMNIQELATLKRYQLPVKILLIDNSRLGMVRQWQALFFDGRYSETDLSDNPDFCQLASAFGIKTQLISKPAQVEDALNNMLCHDGPYLLHVKIDAKENVWPLVPPETANHKMLETIA